MGLFHLLHLPVGGTYLLGLGDVLSRVVLAGLLRVVRHRPLALGVLLCRGCVRHFECGDVVVVVNALVLKRPKCSIEPSVRSWQSSDPL
jgi:hypothetical protein